MDPTYPLVPISNFLGCFLVLVSLSPDTLKSRNVGICMFALWITLAGFYSGVNAIIWKDNEKNIAPVWCDITSHLDIGSNVGVPACSFAITHRLYRITSLRNTYTAGSSKRKEILFDLLLCLGLPILVMALYYVVQGARFEIWEEIGCGDAEQFSGVSILLIDGWSIIFPLISVLFYCPRIFWNIYRQRREINEFLDSNSSVNRSNFWRMLALGCLDALLTLPLSLIGLIDYIREVPLVFYQSWAHLHTEWQPVFVSKKDWEELGFWFIFSVKWNEWINPLFALIIFFLFGTTEKARARYRHVLWAAAKPFGYKPPVKLEASEVVFGSVASPESRGSGVLSGQDQSVEYSGGEVGTFNKLPGAEEGHANCGTATRVVTPSLA